MIDVGNFHALVFGNKSYVLGAGILIQGSGILVEYAPVLDEYTCILDQPSRTQEEYTTTLGEDNGKTTYPQHGAGRNSED